MNACDFGTPDCGPVVWVYDCDQYSIEIHGQRHTNIGAFFACAECSDLVEREQWPVLFIRISNALPPSAVEARIVGAEYLSKWWKGFREHRVGDRRLATERDHANALALQTEVGL